MTDIVPIRFVRSQRSKWAHYKRRLKLQWEQHVHKVCEWIAIDTADKLNWNDIGNRKELTDDETHVLIRAVLAAFGPCEVEVIEHYVHLVMVTAMLEVLVKEGEVQRQDTPQGPMYRLKIS